MDGEASEVRMPRHPRPSGMSNRLRASIAAAMLMTVSGAAMAQPQQPTTGNSRWSAATRSAQVWRTDPLIRDHVEPGDDARRNAHSDFYSADYNGRTSLAPMLALQPQPPLMDVAVAKAAE